MTCEGHITQSRVIFKFRSGCSEPCPSELWVSLGMEMPQPISNLFQHITTLILKVFFLCIDEISCFNLCVASCLPVVPFCKDSWLCLPYHHFCWVAEDSSWILPSLTRSFSKLNKTSSLSVFSYITSCSSHCILVILHWTYFSLSIKKTPP